MRHSISIILFLILTTDLCAQIIDGDKRVIFSKDTTIYFITRDTPYYRFTPTIENIDTVDVVLKKFFVTLKTKEGYQPTLDNYYRQYVGMWLNGRNCIYINAFCRRPEYFLQKTYYPKGGGECYFRTFVDLNTKTVFDFGFNAPR